MFQLNERMFESVSASARIRACYSTDHADGTDYKPHCSPARLTHALGCQVAKVDALQLSQYELYSSRVKDFEVRGRQSHPRAQGSDYSKALNTSGWQLLGKYTAAKTRGSQVHAVSVAGAE